MSETITLPAERRERTGKGAARELRRQSKVPAIIYGGKEPPVQIALPHKETRHALTTNPRFFSTVIELDFGGGTTSKVLAREAQLHPVSDEPLHIDFLRAEGGTELTVEIPVRFIHEELSPGIKRGGTLNIVRREIELVCPADAIPDEFVVDLSGLDIGESIHISQLTLPPRVQLTIADRDFTIVSLVPPSAEEEEETPATEAEAGAS